MSGFRALMGFVQGWRFLVVQTVLGALGPTACGRALDLKAVWNYILRLCGVQI